VTRPANGCGGCTKYAMKSSTAQQGTWRTRDGSAWWLRDAKYNEPNGNYHANCYLHIYDVNPNNVRFDDNNCNFYSTHYLCQPEKKKVTWRSDFNNANNFDGWSCGKITSCGKFGNVCGGYGVKAKGAEIKKTFKLPAGAYSVTLDFIRLDSWDNERAHVSVNGKQCWTKTFHYSKGAKVCGGGWNDETFKVTGCTGTLSKAGPLTVRVWTTIDQDARDESFGIDNVVVTYGAKPKTGCKSLTYVERKDFGGTFDQRQAKCLKSYPGGPGLAVVHSAADMTRARKACTGNCLLGVRWHQNEWKWVDGKTLGWNGKAGGYQRWGGSQPQKHSKNNHGETTAGFGPWGKDRMEWHDAGNVKSPFGTTLCSRCG